MSDSVFDKNKELNDSLGEQLRLLQEAIEANETALKEMVVPTDTRFKFRSFYDDDYQPSGEHQVFVGMIKINGAWRLCYGTNFFRYNAPDEDEVSWTPLVDVSIRERLEAVEHIPSLKGEIMTSKEKLIPRIAGAVASLKDSLASIPKVEKKRKS